MWIELHEVCSTELVRAPDGHLVVRERRRRRRTPSPTGYAPGLIENPPAHHVIRERRRKRRSWFPTGRGTGSARQDAALSALALGFVILLIVFALAQISDPGTNVSPTPGPQQDVAAQPAMPTPPVILLIYQDDKKPPAGPSH